MLKVFFYFYCLFTKKKVIIIIDNTVEVKTLSNIAEDKDFYRLIGEVYCENFKDNK